MAFWVLGFGEADLYPSEFLCFWRHILAVMADLIFSTEIWICIHQSRLSTSSTKRG